MLFLLFFLCFFNSCSLVTCDDFKPPVYVKYANEIIDQHIKESSEKEGLQIFGVGGGYMNDVNCIELHYRYPKRVTVPEARKKLMPITKSLLEKINNYQKIRPYLHNYPFTEKDIIIGITFEHDSSNNNAVDLVMMHEGHDIKYIRFNGVNREYLHKESYQEALKIK